MFKFVSPSFNFTSLKSRPCKKGFAYKSFSLSFSPRRRATLRCRTGTRAESLRGTQGAGLCQGSWDPRRHCAAHTSGPCPRGLRKRVPIQEFPPLFGGGHSLVAPGPSGLPCSLGELAPAPSREIRHWKLCCVQELSACDPRSGRSSGWGSDSFSS